MIRNINILNNEPTLLNISYGDMFRWCDDVYMKLDDFHLEHKATDGHFFCVNMNNGTICIFGDSIVVEPVKAVDINISL